MPSRPLGYFETLLYCAHQRGNSQLTLTLDLTGELTESHLRQAFQTLFIKHPLLRSTVHEYDDMLHFEIHDDFTMIPIVFHTQNSDTNYDAVFQQQASQQLPLDQHNWSAAIVQSDKHTFRLIWHISHVIADGLSCLNLLQELITLLDHQIDNTPIVSKQHQLYSSIEHYLQTGLSIADYFAHQQQAAANISSKSLSPLPKNQHADTCYFIRLLNKNTTRQLQQIATDHQVTLNNLINAALAKSYQQLEQTDSHIGIGSAINLRNKCTPKIPHDVCGNYFTAVTIALNHTDVMEPLTQLAKIYREQLGRVIANKIFLPTEYQPGDMYQTVQSFMYPPLDQPQSERLGSSYLGTIPFNSTHLKIENFNMYPKHANGNNLISTIFNNELSMMFCFAPEYRTLEWANQLADGVLTELKCILNRKP